MQEQLHQPTGYTIIPQEAGVAAAVNFDTRQMTKNVAVYSRQNLTEGRPREISPPSPVVAQASRIVTKAATSYLEAVESLDTDEFKEAQRVRAEQRQHEREANEQRKRDGNNEARVTETVRLNGDRTYRLRPATPEQIEQVSNRGSRRSAASHNRLILDAPADDQNINTRRLRVKLRITAHQEDIIVPDETAQDGFRIERVPAGTAILHRKGRIDHRVSLENGARGVERYRIDREHVDQTVILADRKTVNDMLATNPPTEDEREALRQDLENERQAKREKWKWLGLVATGTLLAGTISEAFHRNDSPQLLGERRPALHDTRGTRGDEQPSSRHSTPSTQPKINLTTTVDGTVLWSFEAEELNIAQPGLQTENPQLFNTEVLAWVRASEDISQNILEIQNYRHMSRTEGVRAYTAQAMELYDQLEQPKPVHALKQGAVTPKEWQEINEISTLKQNFETLEQTPITGDGLNDQTDAKNPLVQTAAKKVSSLLQKLSHLFSPQNGPKR